MFEIGPGSFAASYQRLASRLLRHQIARVTWAGAARMGFECGFETVGNATIILHDGAPLLASDPWITGPAYFGSWGLAHKIPAEQLESVKKCKYLWVSHGHPDHL